MQFNVLFNWPFIIFFKYERKTGFKNLSHLGTARLWDLDTLLLGNILALLPWN